MLMRTAFGEFFREHRSGNGLRLRDVAERSGLSVAYVSEVERGRKEPSSDVVATLCEALDVPLSVALRDVGERLASDARRVATADALARRASAATTWRAPAEPRRHLHAVPSPVTESAAMSSAATSHGISTTVVAEPVVIEPVVIEPVVIEAVVIESVAEPVVAAPLRSGAPTPDATLLAA